MVTADEFRDPATDLRERWRPDLAAVEHAVAVLRDLPEAEYALVPMWLPGKEYGIWLTGQPVYTATGTAYACVNSHDSGQRVPAFGVARSNVVAAADRGLAGRPGTLGFAVISPDGKWAVFEEFARSASKEEDR